MKDIDVFNYASLRRLAILQDPGVSPNATGLPGLPEVRTLAGATITFALVSCVVALIISAAAWALGNINGNPHVAGKGRIGVLASLGAAILIGSANSLIRFFSAINIG
ncbi:hypothetical protein JOF29_002795 [Kribbella aluminosa]|uniref:Integral membrane protein n=1 Tax=Kribbella aluminosa TaxID=416017 RepID=A0ABS4UJ68_9ACTN|nr:DUF6112 family protein [Kribbella aluminosa]MBP2351712.1 hypothetical protein [Kribbella aluminosa]